MAYKALYRTYRPASFDQVAGQKYIVKTLQNAVIQNKIAHAYLFCGPRGTGKTSIAKIFAKAVNCESDDHKPCLKCENCRAVAENSHPDIVEIDAASNNGVEEVRNLIEKVKYAPIKGKYKVYIIDEVHMMSTGAFNALLKTIEEPPAHVIFILATTEPQKVLPTIISRCQRYDFTKIAPIEMVEHINGVLSKEHIKCENEVVRIIAQLADGGMRDALSILDQCIAYAQDDIQVSHINEIYGITTTREKLELLSYVYNKDVNTLLDKVKIMVEKGIDIKRLTFDLVEILKDSVVYDYTKDTSLLKMLTEDEASILAVKTVKERLTMIDTLMEAYDKYRFAASVGSYFEVCLLNILGDNEKPVHIEFLSDIDHDHLNNKIDEAMKSDQSVAAPIDVEEKNVSRETSEIAIDECEPENSENTVDITDNTDITLEDIPHENPVVQEKVNVERNDGELQNKPPHALDDEFVLQLLVGANKPEKQKDMDCFLHIEEYTVELTWAKPANILKNTEIMASSEKYVILSVDNQAAANDINERDSKNEFKEFMNELLHTYKKIFAVPHEQKTRVIEEFKERMKTHTLPDPIEFSDINNHKTEEKEKTELDMVIDLFGQDNIVITEE